MTRRTAQPDVNKLNTALFIAIARWRRGYHGIGEPKTPEQIGAFVTSMAAFQEKLDRQRAEWEAADE